MAEIVADCPRCRTQKTTFDLYSSTYVGSQHGWQNWYEAFCVCRHCKRSTVFVVKQSRIEDKNFFAKSGPEKLSGNANHHVSIDNFVSQKDRDIESPPEHLPKEVESAFLEGSKCLAVGCPNASATMFRLAIDLATRPMLPLEEKPGLNAKTRRDLGLRLPWLFDNGILPSALRELSHCIKEDGNDGAHSGTLTKEDAEDLLDFAFALFERIYTEPKRLELAKERRQARRTPTS